MAANAPTDEGAVQADVRAALREKALQARQRRDTSEMLRAWYEMLRRDPQPRWTDLMRIGQLLHLAGERDRALACFRRATALEGHGIAPVRFRNGGRRAGTLVIGFTVFNGTMAGYRVDFFKAAGLAAAHRLVLWDSAYQCFLRGLPGVVEGYAALLADLQERIARLAPRRVVVAGSSLSGYAALLYGHALRADLVHAFSPPAFLDVAVAEKLEPDATEKMRKLLVELNALALPDRALLDLRSVLRRDNGRSRYFVHYGTLRKDDAFRASVLDGLPGVRLIPHATGNHMIAAVLSQQGLLARTFATDDAGQMPRLQRGADQPPG